MEKLAEPGVYQAVFLPYSVGDYHVNFYAISSSKTPLCGEAGLLINVANELLMFTMNRVHLQPPYNLSHSGKGDLLGASASAPVSFSLNVVTPEDKIPRDLILDQVGVTCTQAGQVSQGVIERVGLGEYKYSFDMPCICPLPKSRLGQL